MEQGEEQQAPNGEQPSGSRGSKGEKPKLPRPEGIQPCPRCNSQDTKFCYYNNYNIKQPRYYCRSCQRYWTAGGQLRDVPVGSGRRKSKCGKMEEEPQLQPPQSHAGAGPVDPVAAAAAAMAAQQSGMAMPGMLPFMDPAALAAYKPGPGMPSILPGMLPQWAQQVNFSMMDGMLNPAAAAAASHMGKPNEALVALQVASSAPANGSNPAAASEAVAEEDGGGADGRRTRQRIEDEKPSSSSPHPAEARADAPAAAPPPADGGTTTITQAGAAAEALGLGTVGPLSSEWLNLATAGGLGDPQRAMQAQAAQLQAAAAAGYGQAPYGMPGMVWPYAPFAAQQAWQAAAAYGRLQNLTTLDAAAGAVQPSAGLAPDAAQSQPASGFAPPNSAPLPGIWQQMMWQQNAAAMQGMHQQLPLPMVPTTDGRAGSEGVPGPADDPDRAS